MRRPDPLSNPAPLIERIYAYVAYRMGDGPDAEDVVSATFERALRYRHSFDPSRGSPIQWLVGIAKNCMNEAYASRPELAEEAPELVAPDDPAEETVRRATLRAAIAHLTQREQELLALRYGADLAAKAIGELVGARTNAVEVALHRALAHLRAELERAEERESASGVSRELSESA